MQLTWIDLNTWLIQIGKQTILIDPWLVDPLIFYGQPWLFTAYHQKPPRYTPETLPPIDLILISQGLDDHCHRPTLEQLDRQIPIVVSPAAAKTVQQLGYHQVQVLAPGQEYRVAEQLRILAVPGATAQPGQVENGYLIQEGIQGARLYYEPHATPEATRSQAELAGVEVVIAPVIGQVFPLLGQVIMGPQQALELIQHLRPQFFLPTTVGAVNASGILPRLVQSIGSVTEFAERLQASGLPTQFMALEPGQSIDLAL